MRRRLNLLLTLIFLMLVFLCGAGAYFTDQQQASIRAAAASMELTVSKPSYGTIPKEIEKDSRLTVQFQIRNESSVPVYLSDQHVLYVNGIEEKERRVRLERTTGTALSGTGGNSGTAAGTNAVLRLAAGESRVLDYVLSFPGAEALPEGVLALKGKLLLRAATSADGTSGFTHGPVTGVLDLTGGELHIPTRSRSVLLSELVEAGSHPIEEIRWYRAAGMEGAGTPGSRMQWSSFDVAKLLTLQRNIPQYVRYELVAKAGVVRSPVYEITLAAQGIQAKAYDYFDGKEVSADISVSKEAI